MPLSRTQRRRERRAEPLGSGEGIATYISKSRFTPRHYEYDKKGNEGYITDALGYTANRLATVTTARGITTLYTYDEKTGLITAIGFTDPDTTRQQYTYNILGQPTEITDAAGTRTLTYDRYGTLQQESLGVAGSAFSLQENTDSYGRNIGYSLTRNNNRLCAAVTGYAADGRIGSAGFVYSGQEKRFTYAYLPGSNLISGISMPNNLTLTQSYEAKRDLLEGMDYKHSVTGSLTRRHYEYDALGRPTARQIDYPARQEAQAATFGYNERSELTAATLDGAPYAYAYDNIGNRITAQEAAEEITYTTNELNQYTQIDTAGSDFEPKYDADGNQIRVKTSTGIWHVTYNAQNRAIRFESEDGATVITCDYDYMGRRIWKKVEQNGSVTNHRRYLYRNYLQIAALNQLEGANLAAYWYITWDPTQPTATRPLAIQTAGTWYTYGWDLTKNICELYADNGYIRNLYTYTPYGTVTQTAGALFQPIQWSSENHDPDLGLIYYNYRYYNPTDGRWTRRDPIGIEGGVNLLRFAQNFPIIIEDNLGMSTDLIFLKSLDDINKITLDDFLGTPNLQSNFLAYTVTSYRPKGPCECIDSNTVGLKNTKVYAVFFKTASWKREDILGGKKRDEKNYLLTHEKIHMYITFKETEKVQKEMDKLRVKISDYNDKRAACNELLTQIKALAEGFYMKNVKPLQTKYDEETDHGNIEIQQNKYINEFNSSLRKAKVQVNNI